LMHAAQLLLPQIFPTFADMNLAIWGLTDAVIPYPQAFLHFVGLDGRAAATAALAAIASCVTNDNWGEAEKERWVLIDSSK
jgi:hypothetical protein